MLSHTFSIVITCLPYKLCGVFPTVSLYNISPALFSGFPLIFLQALHVTCKPCKFEIPADSFPRKVPVNPCKHLQCMVSLSTIPDIVRFEIVLNNTNSPV